MERLRSSAMDFGDVYANRRVLVTGLTGFKGSWLAVWLNRLGAVVQGYSKDVPSDPNHFSLLGLNDSNALDIRGDVCDYERLREVLYRFEPRIVFHLAAQPLVGRSYEAPLETFSVNAMGTANLLQSCLESDSVQAVVVVTTDKVYQNRERARGYKESDRLGGHDPYAASKACAELICESFRQSFFNRKGALLATARAGNVIGGGDWARDRLFPDLMRAAEEGETPTLRMPQSVRPWQHVLEPLRGYLMLGRKLLEGDARFATAWNFAPRLENQVAVENVVTLAQKHWDRIRVNFETNARWHETTLLTLNGARAFSRLGWKPVWGIEETVYRTVQWYKSYYETETVLTEKQLDCYIESCISST